MGKARILPERQIVGEIALELIAQHLLLARELVDAGIASEKAGRDLAEPSVDHRALIGQEVDATGFLPGS
ncbi:hypothetical protein ACVWZK_005212 [Bradyrhizobium sp. GM0.4]